MKVTFYILLLFAFCNSPTVAQDKSGSSNRERVYLCADRNIYLAGDNLFYAIYLKGSPGQLSRYAYLVLRDRNNVAVARDRVDLKNQMACGNLFLPDTLPTDIYQIVCFTNYMKNEGEDSFFTKEIIVANRFDKKTDLADSTNIPDQFPLLISGSQRNNIGNENLIIHLDKTGFKLRERVMFSLEARNLYGDSIKNISVAVREIVPGTLQSPSISDYFKSNTEHNVSSGYGHNRTNYHREYSESVIEGRVLISKSENQTDPGERKTERDIKNYTILVSTPDSIANLQYTRTDSSGAFCVFLNHYYEGKELIIRVKENSSAGIEIDNKFKLIKPFIPSELINNPDIRSYLIRILKIAEVQRYYDEKRELISVNSVNKPISIPRVYYKPYSRVFPGDYLPLPDFSEISRELLPASRIRKINDHYSLNFIDFRNKDIPYLEPVIFLDGVLIDAVDQIINLSSSQVKRVDILPVIRYYGEMSLPGILSVISKKMEINNIQFKTPVVKYLALSSQTYTIPRKFTQAELNEHIPDLRQSLLWDPNVYLINNEKKQVECFTSDLSGIFEISIQGITLQGIPVNCSAIITVKTK
jgi:hypothetical protein